MTGGLFVFSLSDYVSTSLTKPITFDIESTVSLNIQIHICMYVLSERHCQRSSSVNLYACLGQGIFYHVKKKSLSCLPKYIS